MVLRAIEKGHTTGAKDALDDAGLWLLACFSAGASRLILAGFLDRDATAGLNRVKAVQCQRFLHHCRFDIIRWPCRAFANGLVAGKAVLALENCHAFGANNASDATPGLDWLNWSLDHFHYCGSGWV